MEAILWCLDGKYKQEANEKNQFLICNFKFEIKS